ncbi:thioesterase [Sporothrix brasiliensis 5110]|uniref:Thioesterase n=1 Tax=Sporothrix brasiliensis 5110 TaxID=1398154 RepID=A0A0C2ISH7_9PEZI|nr:thioesterase [Sporothrix brasiliensis 5110]KIH91996.1 thioesterase [Sporothrix brasiliensis 5110]
MVDSNPNLIQDDLRQRNAIPLILIHDGSGTIFSYYILDNIDRKLLGIANPRFKSGIPWAGGLREMATIYAGLVASAILSGPVILGGWSLGGLLALETAHVLSQSYPDVSVAGLVLIDSVYPLPPKAGWSVPGMRLAELRIEWPATTTRATKICVERCFKEAYRMTTAYFTSTSTAKIDD